MIVYWVQCTNNHTTLCSMKSIDHIKIKSGKFEKALVCPFQSGENDTLYKTVELSLEINPDLK